MTDHPSSRSRFAVFGCTTHTMRMLSAYQPTIGAAGRSRDAAAVHERPPPKRNALL